MGKSANFDELRSWLITYFHQEPWYQLNHHCWHICNQGSCSHGYKNIVEKLALCRVLLGGLGWKGATEGANLGCPGLIECFNNSDYGSFFLGKKCHWFFFWVIGRNLGHLFVEHGIFGVHYFVCYLQLLLYVILPYISIPGGGTQGASTNGCLFAVCGADPTYIKVSTFLAPTDSFGADFSGAFWVGKETFPPNLEDTKSDSRMLEKCIASEARYRLRLRCSILESPLSTN